uniref:Uncharacterized protein n=1 Tax=Arundo donax TaxID=35708 RepID=A0A0A9CE64_ARUDO
MDIGLLLSSCVAELGLDAFQCQALPFTIL